MTIFAKIKLKTTLVIIAITSAAIAGLLPAWKASRLPAIVALRRE